MKTKEEVLQLLADLGQTEQEVADKLMAMGIKGDRNKYENCPIAQYLIRNGVGVEVEDTIGDVVVVGVEVGLAVGYYWFSFSDYPQVKPVYDFIQSFDAGKYPQLGFIPHYP